MRKLTVLLFVLLASPAMLSAVQEKLQGWCQNGGQTIATAGVESTDKVQQSFPSCTVTIFDVGTTDLASIFSDEVGTGKANPFTASTTGYWFFYAADADYDIKFSGGGIPVPFTLTDFTLFSSGAGITTLNSLTGATQTFADGTNVTMTSAGTTHTLGWTGDLAVADGGSGAGTFTADGVLMGNTTSAFQVTAAGSANEVLRVPGAGGTPAFGQVDISKSAAVTGALAISNGGTSQTTQTAAFDALSPTTTKGDVIVSNGSDNIRLAIGSDGECYKANSAQASGTEWSTCLPADPLTVGDGGTGVTTLTGVGIGTGTSALTPVAASSQLQELRRKPNQTSITYEFATPTHLVSTDFDFPSQEPGGTLTAAVGADITLTPCPLGLNGADATHYVYISAGGGGSAEAVLITGGTCTSGATTGSLTFTPANNHTGAWVVTSATGGVQEAVCFLPSGNNIVQVPQGTTTLNATVGWCGETNAIIRLSNGLTLAGTGSLPTETTSAFLIDHRGRNVAGPCTKTTVASTNAAFIVASTTTDVALFTLPQYGKVTGITVKHSAQYSDAGGSITDISVSIGNAVAPYTQYTNILSIGEVTSVADTAFLDATGFKSTTMASAGGAISAHFIATGANFGDGAATDLTGGSVDLWVCWETLQ